MVNFSCKIGCMKLLFLQNVVVLLLCLTTALPLQDSQSREFKSSTTPELPPWSSVPKWSIDAIRDYFLEKDTSSSTVIRTFNFNWEEQLNTCIQCDMKNRLSLITKTEPEPMMEVSLLLSVRQLYDEQKHLCSDFNI